MNYWRIGFLAAVVLVLCPLYPCGAIADEEAGIPKVGDKASDFTLQTISGDSARLWALTARGPVVLVVLRGYPGYQCPLCSAQVGDLLAHHKQFQDAGAQVLLVYPGQGNELKQRAGEFLAGKQLPAGVLLVTDPDYKLTSAYGLRWDAANETAYPATFAIDAQNTIRYAKVSHMHGDRASTEEVLAVLPRKK